MAGKGNPNLHKFSPGTDAANKKRSELADRLVGRMLDECFACLREGIVTDADLLDAGMVLGTGFAPFYGGPMSYAKSKGIPELFEQFARLGKALSNGNRLELLELLAQGERNVDALSKLSGLTVVNTSQHLRQLHHRRIL